MGPCLRSDGDYAVAQSRLEAAHFAGSRAVERSFWFAIMSGSDRVRQAGLCCGEDRSVRTDVRPRSSVVQVSLVGLAGCLV